MTNEKLIEKLEIKIFQISTHSSLLKMFLPAIVGCVIFNYILIGYSFYKDEITAYPFFSAIVCILFGVIAIGYAHNKTITQFIDGFI